MTRRRIAKDLGCDSVLAGPRRAGGPRKSPARAEVRPKTSEATRKHFFSDSDVRA
jgi:hypothetical protein